MNKFARMVSRDLRPLEITVKEQTRILLESPLDNSAIYKETERILDWSQNKKVARYRYAFKFPHTLSVILLNSTISIASHQVIDTLNYYLDDDTERVIHLISEDIHHETDPRLKMMLSMNLRVGETILLKNKSLIISVVFLGYHTLIGKKNYVFKVENIHERHPNLKGESFYEYIVESLLLSEY